MLERHYQSIFAILFLSLTCFSAIVGASEQKTLLTKTNLYEAGKDGYTTYRIPAIIVTKKGTILIFCAARKDGFGDWSEIDISMRRSMDEGKTWSDPQIIADAGKATVDNPVPIVDLQTGAIHFLHQVNYARAYYMRSDDDGLTFSEPVEITETFLKFRQEYDWKVIACGPGHGIRLKNGRLLVPIWMSTGGKSGKSHRPSCVSVIYSDDHGKSWDRGEILINNCKRVPNPSETVAVELTDERVMLNVRNESKKYRRLISYSDNGIDNWSEPQFDEGLYEPICFGSLIRLSKAKNSDKTRLLFANPDSSADAATLGLKWPGRLRKNVTVKLSYDEGKTWPVAKSLESGISGYSDLAVGPDNSIYCFYESGNVYPDNSKIATKYLTFAKFNLEWLTDGKDSLDK